MASRRQPAASAVVAQIAAVGRADQTEKGRASANGLFTDFQGENGENIYEDLQLMKIRHRDNEADADELAQELVTSTLTLYSHYLSSTEIPNKKRAGKVCSDATTKQYFGQTKEAIKEASSWCSIWEDEKEWYPKLLENVAKAASRHLLSGDADFKDEKCRALYRRIDRSYLIQTQHGWIELPGIDLENVCHQLIAAPYSYPRRGSRYQKRAQIILTFLGAARGGETRFLRYDYCWWDDWNHCLEWIFTQIKVLKMKRIYTVNDYDSYIFDLFHALGCFFAVEKGAYRRDPEARSAKFVFQDMQQIPSAKVTRDLTAVLRYFSAPELRDVTMARGIRKGANTNLCHPKYGVSEQQQRLHGGFAKGDNSESYIISMPALLLGPAKGSTGHPDTKKDVYPPRLDPIIRKYGGVIVEKFINKLYLVTVPQLMVGGRLRKMLLTCAASNIMSHTTMETQFGRTNDMVCWMKTVARETQIAPTEEECYVRLGMWATEISDDWKCVNRSSAADADIATQLSMLVDANRDVCLQLKEQKLAMHSQHSAIVELQSGFTGLPAQVGSLISGTISGLFKRKSPPPSQPLAELQSDSSQKRQKTAVSSVDAATTATAELTRNAPAAAAAPAAQASTSGRKKTVVVLAHGARTQECVENSNANKTVQDVFDDFYKRGQLKRYDNICDIPKPDYIKGENDKFKAFMELAHLVWKENIKFGRLKAGGLDDTEKLGLILAFQEDIKVKMKTLDGQTRTTKNTIIALGNRYNKWKAKKQIEASSHQSFFRRAATAVTSALSPSKSKKN
jgi:hypothetical protein